MTEQIQSKIDTQIVDNPLDIDSDAWADFRQIERITLELTQSYKHSLGKYSHFFIELENGRFFGTKCLDCEKVYAPPRPLCPDCLSITRWHELSGEGTLETYSILHFSPGSNGDVQALDTPYIFAYVLLDGASTLFPHLLKADINQVAMGMRVTVHYVNHSVHHPIHLMHFIPLEN